MKRYLKTLTIDQRKLSAFVLATVCTLPLPSIAASVALATGPLATSTTSTVKPNVMFILDDSGSMASDYLPDWANDNDPITGTGYLNIPPLHRNNGFNGVAYNPAITYAPPVLYDASGALNTTTYPNIGSPWTSVKTDAFGILTTATTNLITTFPDVEWCTSNAFTTCLRNDNLVLPGTVGGVAYTVRHVINSTGTGSVATGAPDAPTVVARSFGPYYYTINPGEYCTALDLKNCQTTQNSLYTFPAKLRWCNSAAASTSSAPAAGTCQAINDPTFQYPRYPTRFFTPGNPGSPAVPAVAPVAAVPGVFPTGLITFGGTTSGTNNASIARSLSSNRTIIISGSGTASSANPLVIGTNKTPTQAAAAVVTSIGTGGVIKAYIGGNPITPTCASKTAVVVCLVDTTTNTNGSNVTTGNTSNFGGLTLSTTPTAGGVTPVAAVAGSPFIPAVPATPAGYFGSFTRTDIVPSVTSYPKSANRTDCAGATCTYAEEMTNFANWWTYYHTRMQAMKSSVSRAFKTLDNRYRVGFTTINETGATNGARFLGNNTFELAHKNSWYTKLFSTAAGSFTPLRGALSKAGRYYGNKLPNQVDPIQYSCQQNFAILSTDGYWNTDNETSSYKALNLAGGAIGNLDGGSTLPPMKEGITPVSDTLADIAKYYYETDLRPYTNPSATPPTCPLGGISTDYPSGNPDVCLDNVFVSSTDNNTKQHMTTFTMGLGIDGTLNYTTDYNTATSGDFFNLKNSLGSPTVRWPNPIASGEGGARIDDLWHAAVNGRGLYFSAKDPDQIITGFRTALSSITAKLGAAAAAATSTLNPVAGNNFAYVASYTTNSWKGNLESRTINTTTGVVSETATWCVENVAAQTCSSPGTIVANTSGSATIYNCVVTGATAGTCPSPGVFDAGSSECRTEIQNACTGTMAAKVAPTSDTRAIYTANSTGNALIPFDTAYAAANPSFFSAARINTLNQWGLLSTSQQTAATGANLLKYLRGQNANEDRASNLAADRLYRAREATLGDALESQPAFISKPVFSYPYPGYSEYKTAQASRPGTVYMGANDGMMHAFAADTGIERWAYVPSLVIPNLWKLADTNYTHVNFVNGSPITSDICAANCTNAATAVWKTILVGGLNGGGRGYYALDITNANTPALLWEFTPAVDSDLGYSFGLPVITRKADGTWVVVVTSGYDNGTLSGNPAVNNSPAGNGRGYLYVLNANSGAIISKISTGEGDATTPSGLAKFAVFNDEPAGTGNLAGYTYGGDLLGNLWRFDINSAASATIGTGAVMKFATLLDPSGVAQPITTTPVLGKISDKRVVFVGTGKYLETADLTTTQIQTQYAIKDDNAITTLVNPRTTLVQQTLTNTAGTGSRKSSNNAVDFSSGRGWYVNFPDSKERVNIDSRLVEGTLLIPSIVPSNTVCSPGGFGWLNFLDFRTGGCIDATCESGSKYDAPIVGVNVIYIDGKPKVEVVTSVNPTPEEDKHVLFKGSSSGFSGKRVLWRELKK
jgi:type IV pilus assembly protein PilY1